MSWTPEALAPPGIHTFILPFYLSKGYLSSVDPSSRLLSLAIVADVSVDSQNHRCPSKPSPIQKGMDARKLYFQNLLITAHWILLIRVTLFKNQRHK